MAITLGLVEAVDDNGVYVSMPGSRGVLRGPYRTAENVGDGATVLLTTTDDGETVVVCAPGASGPVFNVRSFTAVGDGTTDDTAAVQATIDAAVAAGGTALFPPGTYRVTSQVTVDGSCRITGSGTIDAVVPGTYVPAVLVTGDNIVIDGITIDGNKSEFAGVTEWKHGLAIRGCTNVAVRDVTSVNNKGDGVLVAGVDGGAAYCTGVLLENITSDSNHRQGLSITNGVSVSVIGGTFSNTSGTAPSSGIDIEPDDSDGTVTDIEVVGVQLVDNDGAGISVYTLDVVNHGGIRIVGGRCSGNGESGVVLHTVRHVTVQQMVIEDNAEIGVEVMGTAMREVRIDGNLIRGNGHRGISAVMPSVAIEGLVITGNTVLDNCVTVPDSGIRVDAAGPVVTAYNRSGNTGTGDQQYGLTTSSAVTSETHICNNTDGNGVVGTVFAGTNRTVIKPGEITVGTLAHTGTSLGFYGTTPTTKPTVTGSRGGNAALQSLLTGLAGLGLITDSSS